MLKISLLAFSSVIFCELASANFFEGARRRNAQGAEKVAVARIWAQNTPSMKATAFFVANSGQRLYMLTAKHVLSSAGDIQTNCKAGRIHLDVGGRRGKCEQVFFTSGDFVFFEASFGRSLDYSRVQPLYVSAAEPQVGDALVTIGFPLDPERRGRLTVTDQCFVLPHSRTLQPADFTDQDFQTWQISRIAAGKSARKQKGSRERSYKGNRFQTHTMNCSVYGGNSGGPVLHAGTLRVVGMPGGFYPQVNSTYSNQLGLPMIAFDRSFKGRLHKSGVLFQ